MATRTITHVIDDLDGSTDDVRNVRFSIDGTHFEIDLNEAHINELHEALKRFTAAGRRLSTQAAAGQPRRGSAAGARHPDPKAVRAWATEKGMELPARGRFPKAVTEAYLAAHD